MSGVTQEGFRFINDDGDEDASTFMAVQDANVSMLAGTAGRVRILLDTIGDAAAAQYQLEFRYKPPGGAFGDWGKVESIAPYIHVAGIGIPTTSVISEDPVSVSGLTLPVLDVPSVSVSTQVS
jgi:hypothetical protein